MGFGIIAITFAFVTVLLIIDVIGTPFFLYKFVEGRFLKNPSLPSITSPAEKTSIYHSMMDALARVHAVDIYKHFLSNFGPRMSNPDTVPYVLRQVKTWSKQYRATETETIKDMDFLIAELPRYLPKHAESSTCLVHGDFRLDNLIFAESSPEGTSMLLMNLIYKSIIVT